MGIITSHYSSETEKPLKHFPHSKRLHSLNSDNCFYRLGKKHTWQSQTFHQPSFTHVTCIICCLVIFKICLQYWAVFIPCRLELLRGTTVSSAGKENLRKQGGRYGEIMLAWLERTFPDIVVVCIGVKFKQDGERAKNGIYKSSFKKKSHYRRLYKRNK